MTKKELKVVFPEGLPKGEVETILNLLHQFRQLCAGFTFPQSTAAIALFLSTTCESIGSNPIEILDFIKSFIELQEEKEDIINE